MAALDNAIKFGNTAAKQTRDTILSYLSGLGVNGAFANTIANVLSAVVLVAGVVAMAALSVVFSAGGFIAGVFLEALGQARVDNQDATNTLIGASLTDLLGVEVSGDDIPKGGDPAGQLARAVSIGGKLHDLLIEEMGGDGGPDNIDGEKAARAFTGFNINFNVSAALLSIITEMESVGFLKNFREIGEQMAQGLGLGRLHRLALTPLMQALVVQPYTRQLGNRYRQTRMQTEQIIKAHAAGLIDDTQFNQDMQDLGYRDGDISAITALMLPRPSAQLIDSLLRAGKITRGQAIAYIQSQGYSSDDADLILQGQALLRTDQVQHALIQDGFSLAQRRHMTEADFAALLDSINISDDEKQLWAQRLSLALQHPTRRLNIGEILYLSERNQITIDDAAQWAIDEGYDDNSQTLLQLFILGKDLDFSNAEKAKAAKAAAAAAKAAAKNATKTPTGQPGA